MIDFAAWAYAHGVEVIVSRTPGARMKRFGESRARKYDPHCLPISSRRVSRDRGEHPPRPFVFVAQQSLFDPERAPVGKHTAWGYCHAPSGSDRNMTDAIEAQIERFAPGFRDRILARHAMGPAAYERYNPNPVGGDIAGGAFSARSLFQFAMRRPYQIGEGL